MTACINLRETYGGKYRVTYEASYYADHGDGSRTDDPWLQQIECTFGTIIPYGGNELAACTHRRGPTAKKLLALDCVTVWQDGDDGVNVRFDAKDFNRVAAVMRPKRKRTLSPEHLAKLSAASAAYRFKPASHASKRPENAPGNDASENTASGPSHARTHSGAQMAAVSGRDFMPAAALASMAKAKGGCRV